MPPLSMVSALYTRLNALLCADTLQHSPQLLHFWLPLLLLRFGRSLRARNSERRSRRGRSRTHRSTGLGRRGCTERGSGRYGDNSVRRHRFPLHTRMCRCGVDGSSSKRRQTVGGRRGGGRRERLRERRMQGGSWRWCRALLLTHEGWSRGRRCGWCLWVKLARWQHLLVYCIGADSIARGGDAPISLLRGVRGSGALQRR